MFSTFDDEGLADADREARLARRLATLDLSLALQVVLALACLALGHRDLLRVEGPLTVGYGALCTVASGLVLLLKANHRAKLSLAIGFNLGTALLTALHTGINGVTEAYFQVGLVYALLWLSPHLVRRVLGISVSLLLVIVVAALTGRLQVHLMDATVPADWRVMLPVAAACSTLVMVILARTLKETEEEARLQEEGHSALVEIGEEHLRAEAELAEANRYLAQEVRSQTAQLENIRQEFEFLSERLIGGLNPMVDALKAESALIQVKFAGSLSDGAKALIARLRTSADSASELIHDLRTLGYADASALRYETVDVSGLAVEILNDLAHQFPGSRVDWKVEPDLKIEGDRGLIRSVLRNLLENAWKFSAKSPSPRVRLTWVERGGLGGIAVEDNGPGFDPQIKTRLFESFVRGGSTSAVAGSGIGLFTVKRIADRHHGQVLVESPESGGSRVIVTFGRRGDLPLPEPTVQLQSLGSFRLPSIQGWRTESLGVLLNAQLLCILPVVIAYSPLLWQRDVKYLASIWACTAILAFVTLQRDWPYRIRAMLGLLPALGLSVVTWLRTTYFTAPVGISLLTCALTLMFFGDAALYGVITALCLSATAGFWLGTQAQSGPLLFNSSSEYWFLQILLGAAPIVLLLLTLGRAIGRLRDVHRKLIQVTVQLNKEISERDRLLAEVRGLRDRLDADVAARSAELVHSIEALSSFSYIVSHDLRSPVRTMFGLVEILREDHGDELSADAEARLTEFKRLNARLATLVEKLIGLAQVLKAEPDPASVDVSEELRQSLPEDTLSEVYPGSLVRVDVKMLRKGLAILAEHVSDYGRLTVSEPQPSVLQFSGLAPVFIESVERCIEVAPEATEPLDESPIDALSLVRICRRMGCSVWTERDARGTPTLSLSLQASR